MKITVIAFSLILFAAACGTPDEPQVTGPAPADTLVLSVTDTIGVLMGDSTLMFGSISGACYHPDGTILILDAMKACLKVFSPDCELLAEHGRNGSGPGEYQYPRYFAVLADSSIAIADWGVNTVTILNPDYSYRETIEGFYPIAPAYICPGRGSSFVAGGMKLQPSDSEAGYDGSTFVGLWDGGSESTVEYTSFPLDIQVESNGESVSVNVDNVDATLTTDIYGNVYVAVRTDSTYRIDRYTPEGVPDLTIEQEWTRIAKNEDELQEEVLIESHSRHDDGSTSAHMTTVEDVYPWKNAISTLNTDDNGNLWVGQGYTSMPVFNVYDTRGELIRVVSIPGLDGVRGLEFSLRNGLLAFDSAPEDYPKVYLLEQL